MAGDEAAFIIERRAWVTDATPHLRPAVRPR